MDVTGPNWDSTPYQNMGYDSNASAIKPVVVAERPSNAGRGRGRGQWGFKSTGTGVGGKKFSRQQSSTSTSSSGSSAPAVGGKKFTRPQSSTSTTSAPNSGKGRGKTLYRPKPYTGNGQKVSASNTQQSSSAGNKQQQQQQYQQKEDGLVETSQGVYKLVLSNFKTMTLTEYQGYCYAHMWDNYHKTKVSLNVDELKQLFEHQGDIEMAMDMLVVGDELMQELETDMN